MQLQLACRMGPYLETGRTCEYESSTRSLKRRWQHVSWSSQSIVPGVWVAYLKGGSISTRKKNSLKRSLPGRAGGCCCSRCQENPQLAASKFNSTRQLSAVVRNGEQAPINSVLSSPLQDQHSSDASAAVLSGASTPDRHAVADGVHVERPAPAAQATGNLRSRVAAAGQNMHGGSAPTRRRHPAQLLRRGRTMGSMVGCWQSLKCASRFLATRQLGFEWLKSSKPCCTLERRSTLWASVSARRQRPSGLRSVPEWASVRDTSFP
jgi:hypothetical protein